MTIARKGRAAAIGLAGVLLVLVVALLLREKEPAPVVATAPTATQRVRSGVDQRPASSLPGVRNTPVSQADTSSPTVRVRSFDSSADVWAFVKAAMESSDPSLAYEAAVAARECAGYARSSPELQSFASGGTSIFGGPLTVERQSAIGNLDRKCGGFLRAGYAGSKELAKAAREHADAVGSRYMRYQFCMEKAFGIPVFQKLGIATVINRWGAAEPTTSSLALQPESVLKADRQCRKENELTNEPRPR